MVLGERGVLEPDETLPEERHAQVSMIEIDSQVPDTISPLIACDIAEEDLDESNANFSDDEGRVDRVVASNPAFSNIEFRQKYMQRLVSGNGSLIDTCSNHDSNIHSRGHLRHPSACAFSHSIADSGLITDHPTIDSNQNLNNIISQQMVHSQS